MSLIKTTYRLLALILLFGLTACTTPPLNHHSTLSKPTLSSCSPPARYALTALHWNNRSRGEELERLAESLDASTTYCSILELAIFLSTPSKSFQDDQKAYLLLRKLDGDPRLSGAEHDFVAHLLPHVEQRQSLREKIKLLQNKINK